MGRKSRLRLVLVVLIALGMPLMSVGAVAKPYATAWMVLYYLDDDNNLEGMGLHDLEELNSSPHNRVKTLVMIDRASNWTDADNSNARYYEVFQGSIVLKEDLGEEVSMGAPASLSNFIIWAKTSYKAANHYALVLEDHGGGWKGVCWDSGDHMNLTDLRVALDAAKNATGIVFDVIGFDACEMAYIEVAYQIKDYAKVMVASQDIEWFYGKGESPTGDPPEGTGGWPNDAIITHLSNNYGTDATGFGTIIVNDYKDFWEHYQPLDSDPTWNDHFLTISAIRLEPIYGMTNLMYAIQEFSLALQERIPTYGPQIMACRNVSAGFGSGLDIDLYHFVDEIDALNMAETRTMKKAMGTIINSIDSMAYAEWHEENHSIAHGVNIFYPADYHGYNRSDVFISRITGDTPYSSNDFCQSVGGSCWDSFLRDILNYPA